MSAAETLTEWENYRNVDGMYQIRRLLIVLTMC